MTDYRNPKVTTPQNKGSSVGKWVSIAIAALVAILLLMWALGSNDDTVEPVSTEPTATEEPADPATTAPSTTTAPEPEDPATTEPSTTTTPLAPEAD